MNEKFNSQIFWSILERHIGPIHSTLKNFITAISYDSFISWKGLHSRNLDPLTIVEEIEEFANQLDEDGFKVYGWKQSNLKSFKLPSAFVNAIYGIAEEIKSINFKEEVSMAAKMQQIKYEEVENDIDTDDLDDDELMLTEEEHLEEEGNIESIDHSYSENKEDYQERQYSPAPMIILEEMNLESEIFSSTSRKKCRKFAERRKIPADPARIDFDAEWQERIRQYLEKFTDLRVKTKEKDFMSIQQINSKNSSSLMWRLGCPIHGCKSKLTLSCSFNPLPNFRASNFLKHLELHRKWVKEKRVSKVHAED